MELILLESSNLSFKKNMLLIDLIFLKVFINKI